MIEKIATRKDSERSEDREHSERVIIRKLRQVNYLLSFETMRSFTEQRDFTTLDELWCLEHPPVFTQGQAGKPEHLLKPSHIPVIQTDRGGQITYHGPGQLVVYLLVDIQRKGFGVRAFVSKIEQAVIDMLANYKITGESNPKAPGVYVNGAKICSLGLRIRRGASFHGLSLNVDMDLSPFQNINPCGFAALPVVQMKAFVENIVLNEVQEALIKQLCLHLGYNVIKVLNEKPWPESMRTD